MKKQAKINIAGKMFLSSEMTYFSECFLSPEGNGNRQRYNVLIFW